MSDVTRVVRVLVVSVVGCALAVVCVLYFRGKAAPTSGKPSKTRWVTVTDSKGRVLQSGLETYTEPDHFESKGLDHLKTYVQRMAASKNWMSDVTVFTSNGESGFALQKMDGDVTFQITVEWRQQPGQEAKIRAFFKKLGISPTEDYLAGNGGVPDATRVFSWPLPSDPERIETISKEAAKQLCGITDNTPIDIQFQEQKDERGKYAGSGGIDIYSVEVH
jgi:hypothetical protein